jgi:meso-butanediol dehydrogenase / (S,S)-butanediol dehydrogenase / diacetyl reductase
LLFILEKEEFMKLEGKVALVTGGGTGIGAAIVERFVAEGARVCITGRRKEMLEKVASRLPGEAIITCPGDVSKSEDVERMVSSVIKFGGKLDILVNNAGMPSHGSVDDLDLADWRRALDVNLTGPFLLMKASIPHMRKAGGGSIINIASLAGLRCIPAGAAYCSSKAGLIMLTRQAALDYGPYKIRCNVICPGAVQTPMLEGVIDELKNDLNTDTAGALAHFTANSPLRRAAVPREISGICAFLAGEDSSFMTGAVLVADGGAAVVDANSVVRIPSGSS